MQVLNRLQIYLLCYSNNLLKILEVNITVVLDNNYQNHQYEIDSNYLH